MGSARVLKLALAGALLCAATPAMASDFSGIIYAFLFVGVIVGAIVALVVFAIRRASDSSSRLFDASCALALGAALAPAGIVDGFDGLMFSPVPAWIWLWLWAVEAGGAASFVGPVVAIVLLTLGFFQFFRFRRSRNALSTSDEFE